MGWQKEPMTLAEIGTKYKLTRERVRQIVSIRLDKLSRYGGPPFVRLLSAITGQCVMAVCPFTPELLAKWLAPRKLSRRFNTSFYVRVIGALTPECPAWPDGRSIGWPNDRQADIGSAVNQMLHGRFKPSAAPEILRQLKFNSKFSSVTPLEFLDAIHADNSVAIKFGQPDQLQILPPVPEPLDCIKIVLEQSKCPLRPMDIQQQAQEMWGQRALAMPIHRLVRRLRPEEGFFMLNEDSFGLRKHIQLPESQWSMIREEVRSLLERDSWSVSTFALVTQPRCDWATQTNPYELAAILRMDPRFADLGRCSFALSTAYRPDAMGLELSAT